MNITFDTTRNCYVNLYRAGMYVIYLKNKHGRNDEAMLDIANKPRQYRINRQKVQSACIALWKVKNSKNLLFLTYTFAWDVQEKTAAAIWQAHLDNLKKTFKVKNYVWVKERQKSRRIHYHLLVDLNRIDIINLQNSFNSTILYHCRDCIVSNNSVRLGDDPVLYNVASVKRYLSKYISKDKGDNFCCKAYGYTEMKLFKTIDVIDFMQLVEGKKCFVIVDKPYLTVGIIKDYVGLWDS